MSAARDKYKAADPAFGDAPPSWINNLSPSAASDPDKIRVELGLGSFYSQGKGWLDDLNMLFSTAFKSSRMNELFESPVLSYNGKEMTIKVSNELTKSVQPSVIMQIIVSIISVAEKKEKIAVPAYAKISSYGDSAVKIYM